MSAIDNTLQYATVSGNKEYCSYPPKHITEFKFTNQACPLDGPEKQTYSSPNMPPTPVHGGLYTDTKSTGKPWHSIPVSADMNYMVSQNLMSANPPPGANQQYIGTTRPGNNHIELPGVYTYQPQGAPTGMYNFHLL